MIIGPRLPNKDDIKEIEKKKKKTKPKNKEKQSTVNII